MSRRARVARRFTRLLHRLGPKSLLAPTIEDVIAQVRSGDVRHWRWWAGVGGPPKYGTGGRRYVRSRKRLWAGVNETFKARGFTVRFPLEVTKV